MVFDDIASHVVHELLGASLPGNELSLAVLLLFIKHPDVFLLSLHIEFPLQPLLLLRLLFINLVLNQHLLEIVAFLLTLLQLKLSLRLHLLLESLHQLNFSFEIILFFDSAFALLLHQLTVTRLLLLLSFKSLRVSLFFLSYSPQFDVLFHSSSSAISLYTSVKGGA